jgi:hypothetical protein
MSSDYVVCIPSYKRAKLCNDKTLTTLHKMNIEPNKIYVYVANKEEKEEYEKTLDKSFYNKLVIGIKGLAQQRQFIEEQWPKGKHIVFFDDDIESIDLKLSKLFKGKSLDYFFKYAFDECKKMKSYIWGVYPVFNPFFRKDRDEISSCLNYIIGAFYGVINRPKFKPIQLTLTKENGQKEDIERTILYFVEDGIVLRFNKVGFVTKYYGKSGGLGTFDARLKPMLEASKKIQKKYPEYGSVITRKSGMTEFKLKKIPARKQNPNLDPNLNLEKETKRENNKTKHKKRKHNSTKKHIFNIF